MKICKATGCFRMACSKGCCDKHYRRQLKGKPINQLSRYEKSTEQRFLGKFQTQGIHDCWNWTAAILPGKNGGYGAFKVGADCIMNTIRAHRYSYFYHFGINPRRRCVLHTCDNRKCVNPNHLFLGSRADNADDMCKKGRQCRGESRPLSKLTDDAVRSIRMTDESTGALASRFNVSPSAISMARNHRTWRHVV